MQVEQALVEIVSNALDAMPTGGRLRIGAALTDGRRARRRRGHRDRRHRRRAFPTDVLPSVCEPFFTTRQEGTGLGLAIAKRYVEQNGGRLEIASRPGGGHRPGAAVRPADAERARMSGSTVLIVDDERTLARAVKAFLAEAGYEAEVAGDAEQALELLETLRPGRRLQPTCGCRA